MSDRYASGQGVVAIVVALLLSSGAELLAQDAVLPPAESIIARHMAGVGGRDALLAHESLRHRGTFEIPGADLIGELDLLKAQPDRAVMRISIEELGEIRSGFDGRIGWIIDLSGPRLMAGAELQVFRDDSDFLATLREADKFQLRETSELTRMNGEACYRVRLVWQSGRESHDCYSVETGLRIASIDTPDTPMGRIEVTTFYSEYKEFGNLRLPSRVVQILMGDEQVITFDSIVGGAVEPSAFDLPPEIRALVGGN